MNVNEFHNGHRGQQEEQHFGNVAYAFQYLVVDYKMAHLNGKRMMLEIGVRIDVMVERIGRHVENRAGRQIHVNNP